MRLVFPFYFDLVGASTAPATSRTITWPDSLLVTCKAGARCTVISPLVSRTVTGPVLLVRTWPGSIGHFHFPANVLHSNFS